MVLDSGKHGIAAWPNTHEQWQQAAAFVASSDPSGLGQLYEYLISQPEHDGQRRRQGLNRRLREVLMKQLCTVSAPKVAVGVVALIKAEQPGDADGVFTK